MQTHKLLYVRETLRELVRKWGSYCYKIRAKQLYIT